MVAETEADGGLCPSARGGVGGGGGLLTQIADGEPPRRVPSSWPPPPGWGRRGSSAPSPGPGRGDPPSLRGAQPFLPPPGAARPRSPHLETLLHPQLLHGGGGGRAGGRARRGRAGAGRSRRRGRGRSGERAGASAGGGRSLGAAGALAGGRWRRRRRPEPAPPPPAGAPPGAPSLSCSPASRGAAITCLPAPQPRICLPGPGHMEKLRHRRGCSGPVREGHSLIGSPIRPPHHPLPLRVVRLWKVSRISTRTLRKHAHMGPVPGGTQLAVALRRPQRRVGGSLSYTGLGSSWRGATCCENSQVSQESLRGH